MELEKANLGLKLGESERVLIFFLFSQFLRG